MTNANQTVVIARTHALAVDVEKFSQEVKDFIWAYGLRQILNDAGSAGKGADEKLAMAQKKLDSLYAGTLRAARGEALPQLDMLMARFALADVKAQIRAAGKKVSAYAEAKLDAAAVKLLERNDAHYRVKAEKYIDELAKLKETSGNVDLGELGL